MEEKKKQTNKLLVATIALLILLVGIGIVIIVLFLSKPNENNSETISKNQELIEVHEDGSVTIVGNDSFLVLDENNLPSKEELQKKIDDGMMNLKFNDIITVTNGKNGTCSIANSKNNRRDMYVSIWLVETQEEIYRSGLIPIGAKIEQLELNRILDIGEHTAIMVYNQLEDNEIVAQVNVEVTINVIS